MGIAWVDGGYVNLQGWVCHAVRWCAQLVECGVLRRAFAVSYYGGFVVAAMSQGAGAASDRSCGSVGNML